MLGMTHHAEGAPQDRGEQPGEEEQRQSLAACARQAPRYAAAPQGAVAGSELDMRMYGAPQPASYAVRRVAQVVPVAATVEDGPYTLDSGDKLRIVVFGQDTLSNTYTVDA